jgi:hypothetical protein
MPRRDPRAFGDDAHPIGVSLELLGNFDRMNYLRPLYRALNKRDPIARQVIEGLLHN